MVMSQLKTDSLGTNTDSSAPSHIAGPQFLHLQNEGYDKAHLTQWCGIP